MDSNTIEKDKAHAEKMREYYKNNPRKPKAWINNNIQNKLIDLQELDYYLNLNWKRGRYK